MYNPDTAAYATAILDSFRATAKSLGVEPLIAEVRSEPEIKAAIDALGRGHGGLVTLPDSFILSHLAAIIAAADRNRVPTIFEGDPLPRGGGLLSYGVSFADLYRRAAGYVDRILRGENPAICRCRCRQNMDLLSMLRRLRRWGSRYRQRFSRSPTR